MKDKILQLDCPVPRYTSYPTAPNFREIEHGQFIPTDWLKAIEKDNTLSLYLHVPFCSKMCSFCGCHTKVTQRYAPVEDYVHLMLREIEMTAEQLQHDNDVTHIHFGGGSPGMLYPPDFDKVMQRLRQNFNVASDVEISIELDPRHITIERVMSYAQNGVNRVSLGVQDFDSKVLEAVNREQPYALTQEGMALLRQHGIHNINLDLMYGLPYQTVETMTDTMEKALAVNPSRISFFGYAYVPWMKKHMRLVEEDALPDKGRRYDLFEVGSNILKQNGYQQIGIDHFAQEGDSLIKQYKEKKIRRNFQGYTTDIADVLIGIGSSSIGQYREGFVQNSVDMPFYKESILGQRLSARKYYPLTDEDRLRADVIEDIMCYGEVNLKNHCHKHGVEPDYFDADIQKLQQYIDYDFVRVENRVVKITGPQHFLSRLVSHVFDAHVVVAKPQEKKHAQAI